MNNPKPYPTCGAKGRTGKACAKPAGWGTEHAGIGACRLHGGNVPSHRNKAKREIAEREVARFGVPVQTTPQEALLHTLYAAAGRVAWLRRRIETFTPAHGTVVGVMDIATGFDDPNLDPDDGPALLVLERPNEYAVRLVENPLLAMLRTEEKHLVDVAQACHKAGIEQARIDLHKTVADMLVTILARALPELGVTADQDRVIDVVARAMVGMAA